jgi:beta-N-acetylhexosaminidase
VLAAPPTLLMLGHVVVTALDPDHLASGSARLVDGVIRGTWGHQGVVITDDLCMGPVFHGRGSLSAFAPAALRAGVDLLLISYDGTQVYPALAALLRARRDGELADELLQRSEERLDRLGGFFHAHPAPP